MTDTANLEDGFYWVRHNSGTWVVAELYDGFWFFNGDAKPFSSHELWEIDPRPIKREEGELP